MSQQDSLQEFAVGVEAQGREKIGDRYAEVKVHAGIGSLISATNPVKKTAPERHAAGAYFVSGLSRANFPLAAGAMNFRRKAFTRAPPPSICASPVSSWRCAAVSSAT